MEYILTILYGLVEGITEWLPVSSTGHLILLEKFLPLNVSEEFWSLFLVIIQLGDILAVIVLYFNKLFPFKIKEKFKPDKDIFIMWGKILVACIPCIIIVLLKLDDKFEELFYNELSVSIALIAVGILFIIVESLKKNTKIDDIKRLTLVHAFIIGLFQLIAALFPGVSRSGITMTIARAFGIDRESAAKFSFMLAMPITLAAVVFDIGDFSFGWPFVTGVLASFIVGIIITIAEPDLRVLSNQMNAINPYIFIFCVSLGVGLFLAISKAIISFILLFCFWISKKRKNEIISGTEHRGIFHTLLMVFLISLK